MLSFLEKKFRLDARYILRSGFFAGTEHMVSVVSGIVFGLLVANIFSPDQYGAYKYILSIIGIISALTLTELSSSLLKSVAQGYEGTWKYIAKTQIKWSVPAVFVGTGLALYYYFQEALPFAATIFVVTLFIPLRDLGNLSLSYLSGKELFFTKSVLNILRTSISTLLLIFILLSLTDAKILVLSQYAIEALGFILLAWFVIKKYPPNNQVAKSGVKYGKHLSFVDVIQRVGAQLDKIIVYQLFGAVSLALYSIALMPIQQLSSSSKVLRTLIAPRFSKRSHQEIRATIFHKTGLMLLVNGALMMLYIILAPTIFKYLLPQFTDAVFMTQIASLILLTTPRTLFAQVLVAHSHTKELYISAITGNILHLSFLALGAILGGVFGMLLGFVTSRYASLFISIIAYFHAYKTHETKN